MFVYDPFRLPNDRDCVQRPMVSQIRTVVRLSSWPRSLRLGKTLRALSSANEFTDHLCVDRSARSTPAAFRDFDKHGMQSHEVGWRNLDFLPFKYSAVVPDDRL